MEKELEKEQASSTPSVLNDKPVENAGEKKIVESTPLEEAMALEKLSEEPEYPTGAKLGIIVASLCLSVFLMALVCLPSQSKVRHQYSNNMLG